MKRKSLLALSLILIAVVFAPKELLAAHEDTVQLTVVDNDCLINICKRYLEDPRKWPEIGRINRLRDYNLIRSGERLVIPVRLLKGVPVDGKVAFLKGVVEQRPRTDGEWTALHQGDVVRQGSLLRTGADGTLEIAFEDGAALLLRPDTNLDIRTAQRKGSSHLLQRFFLSTGRVVTKVRRATGRDSRIEIQTPSATAVARGTDFRVSVGERKSSNCEVLESVVDVEALHRKVVIGEGEGTRVNIGEPPMPPRKLLPPPQPAPFSAPVRKVPIPVEFSRVRDAAGYRFMLSKDSDGKDVVREGVIGVEEKLEITGVEDGSYFFQARSIDAIGLEGPSSSPLPMTVRQNPLPPFIREPVEGAQVKGKSLRVAWLNVRDAVSYRIQVATDSAFLHSVVETRDLQGTGHEIDLPDIGNYFLRICSVAPDGFAGNWSDVVSFNIVPPPAAPELEKPEGEGKEMRIRWRDQGKGMAYHMQVDRDENFRKPFIDMKVEKPEATIPVPEEPGEYFVRISTLDKDGYEGAFSPPQTFEIRRRLWPYGLGAIGAIGVILLILL